MVCNPSIQFMIYESSLKHLKAKRTANKQGLKNATALEVFLLGALAKLGATVSTYPLLVVKNLSGSKLEETKVAIVLAPLEGYFGNSCNSMVGLLVDQEELSTMEIKIEKKIS
ncbi:unnamed protein product [Ilex paraguariensis]|uniref:Uncharacterized protein n=1 Tax=Ilex paraguariensis TaxID=185542 RepID=A0ABC8U906_9AQUA